MPKNPNLQLHPGRPLLFTTHVPLFKQKLSHTEFRQNAPKNPKRQLHTGWPFSFTTHVPLLKQGKKLHKEFKIIEKTPKL
jgi:hypothetical protein